MPLEVVIPDAVVIPDFEVVIPDVEVVIPDFEVVIPDAYPGSKDTGSSPI
jgi:hypothetical protein